MWMKNHKTRRSISRIKYSVFVLAAIYLCQCISTLPAPRASSFSDGDCMLYYMVNANGMKGLGHSILLLVDKEGCGMVFSFNGMQRSLRECLSGKSGIGKFSTGVMTADETAQFLQSGDLHLDGDQLTDNYDMALYRPITEAEYQTVLEQAAPYLEAEEDFSVLYEKWATEEDDAKKAEYQQALEEMGADENLPLYQIYTDNCDHAARRMAAAVDQELQEYNDSAWRITPNRNLKAFASKAEKWGVMTLGKQSLTERVLMFLIVF